MNKTAECPLCKGAVIERSGLSTYRRGAKSVTVQTLHWECSGSCIGPAGEKPFHYHDARQMQRNDEEARQVWKKNYQEEMPQSSLKIFRNEMPPEDVKMVGWTIRHSVAMVAIIGGYLDHSEVCKKTKIDPQGCKACIFDLMVEKAIRVFETREG